jgi:co-chaperonin GroES (HSP10)
MSNIDFGQLGRKPGYTAPIKASKVIPIKDGIIVTGMNFKERKLASGIVLASDDGKSHGVRPRWAQVYAVGPDQTDVNVGEWIYIEHGRWTRQFDIEKEDGSIVNLWKVDPESVLLSSDEEPLDNGELNPDAVYSSV